MSGISCLKRLRWVGLAWIVTILCLPSVIQAADPSERRAADHERAYRILDEAKSKHARSVRKQAGVLVAHAWPAGGGDPAVAALAREQLVGYRLEGLQALRVALHTVEPHYQFDVIAALIETNARITGGLPSEYLPAVEDAIWFGTLEAARMAIPEAARYRFPLALLSTMDAAHEHPQLVPVATRAMGQHGNRRARRFLKEILRRGHSYERLLAARALGRIGPQGMSALREAARDEDAGCRRAAIETLLPVTGTGDLSLLHEYIGLYPDEDPNLHRMVVQRAVLLESIREKQLEADSASSD